MHADERDRRHAHREKTTGWTKQDFETAWEKQNGCCDVCAEPMLDRGQSSTSVCADHCHVTGKKRGLIHRKCNCALGLANDNVTRLRQLITYLERHAGT
jgi:hypothetical protein